MATFSDAEGYERQLGPWSSTLALRFLEFAEVQNGDRVLDVGSGTGSLALALAASTSCPEIVGIDPSELYVRFAASRTKDPRLRFQPGDAMSLPFPEYYFDKSLGQLVLNQIPDPQRGVEEMCRVTKPGGTVAACVWASGRDNERNWMFWEAAKAVDPASVELRETGGRFGHRGKLSALWTECGLKKIAETSLIISVEFGSFEDYWLPHLEGQARAGSYVRSLPPERRDALRERLRQEIFGAKADAPFSMQARALAVRGVRRAS